MAAVRKGRSLAEIREMLGNKKNFEYARDPDGYRVGRTKYLFLTTAEVEDILYYLPRVPRK